MESDMSQEEFRRFKSERYARQLVRNAFAEISNMEELGENKYAKDIYEQLKADLEQFFNMWVPPSTEPDLCPVCGRRGVPEAMLAAAKRDEAQMWQRNGQDREWAAARLSELETASKETERHK